MKLIPDTSLFRNYISLTGAAVALACLASILLLFLIDITGRRSSPYIGIFAWVLIPAILVGSLIVVGIGVIRERRRRRSLSPDEPATYPSINLNNPHSRRVFLVFLAVAFLFVSVSAFGSYQAFEHTESVAFCGQTCHTVMKPEFVAFQNSPHARLECVDCHVGEGARWYVKSKLNGVHQLYSVTFGTYDKPIKTPVLNMRPANDTCAHCHWAEKFQGSKLRVFDRYAYDEKNTRRQMRLLMNVGGGNPDTGPVSGIHWHMNLSNEINFISTDAQRQVIPWIQAKDRNGNLTVYVAANSTLTPEQIASAPKRRMDCIDCHNRPAHIYNPPDVALDNAFSANRLDTSLPYLKRKAVELLSNPYTTNDEALQSIASGLTDFYRGNYSALYSERRTSVDGVIKEVQRIYQNNFFPEMKTDWQAHPNNIGHLTSTGCFRCHDGEHKSDSGKVISNDCNICHTVLYDSARPVEQNPRTGSFKHPVDLGSLASRKCESCHTANKPFQHPLNLGDISMFQCAECH
ncbi:MAG TPA: NapC/NirT family cytochrome c [Pyrinomonadaceae bacterium]|nr:NapC/NirT family cytochrome c [Pyrinomonadaceae bacterium]